MYQHRRLLQGAKERFDQRCRFQQHHHLFGAEGVNFPDTLDHPMQELSGVVDVNPESFVQPLQVEVRSGLTSDVSPGAEAALLFPCGGLAVRIVRFGKARREAVQRLLHPYTRVLYPHGGCSLFIPEVVCPFRHVPFLHLHPPLPRTFGVDVRLDDDADHILHFRGSLLQRSPRIG